MSINFIPVILSGGAGTRLWPVSREAHPKPFMRLSDGQSLLQKTFIRNAALPGVTEVLTVTNRDVYFKTEDEYQPLNAGGLATSFILEPFGRNTAPAIAAAVEYLSEVYGDTAIILVVPADHLIANETAYAEAVVQAVKLAADGHLVTFGIQPEFPETGYGYIEAADGVGSVSSNAYQVKRFVEKPSSEKAQEYLASGKFFWNSGMFCFQVATFQAELRKHAPQISDAVRGCLEASRKINGNRLSLVELDAASFADVSSISIDYALMEKSANAVVIACDIGWNDIGSWNAISDLAEADGNGNRITGDVLLHDVKNSYIQSEGHLIGVVGVDNLIIVDTPDALLVAHHDRAQDVRNIVSQLKLSGHEAYRLHRTVSRPWGTYTVLEEGSRFKIKRIVVKPGASLSLQMHHHRSEHWVVVSGMAKVVNGDRELLVNCNESTFIPAGHKHRLENPGVIDLVMIEVQSGDYVGEDDIVRFDDHYGRA